MVKKRFSFAWLPCAADDEQIEIRRGLITLAYPDKPRSWVLVAEVAARYAGEAGLSDYRVHYIADEAYRALANVPPPVEV